MGHTFGPHPFSSAYAITQHLPLACNDLNKAPLQDRRETTSPCHLLSECKANFRTFLAIDLGDNIRDETVWVRTISAVLNFHPKTATAPGAHRRLRAFLARIHPMLFRSGSPHPRRKLHDKHRKGSKVSTARITGNQQPALFGLADWNAHHL